MLASPCSDVDRRPDYFSIVPPAYNNNKHINHNSSVDSPCYSPPPLEQEHPLLARLSSLTLESPNMPVANLLQLQTSAAHAPARPRHIQNVLHVTSDDSTSSDSSKSSVDFTYSAPEHARCSRCQRSSSIDWRTGKDKNMMQYGLNLWYCNRCAGMVGMTKT